MNTPALPQRLAVCSWSLRPSDPQNLLDRLRDTGLHRMQIALDPLRDQPDLWGALPELCTRANVQIVSGMFGCLGEDYSTLDTIRLTGGLVPDATWATNWRNIQATATLAQKLGLKFVSFHAGFLPHDELDPSFVKTRDRIAQVADLFARVGITLGLETGQEQAATLARFLEKLARPNLGVNFDPANMILYAQGDPVEAVRRLGPWIRQIHVKDARLTKVPGTWGEEVPVGQGEVNWRAFFAALAQAGFTADACIEREAGEARVTDIRKAREYVSSLF